MIFISINLNEKNISEIIRDISARTEILNDILMYLNDNDIEVLDKEIKKEKLLNDLEKIKKILLRLDKIMEQIETDYL